MDRTRHRTSASRLSRFSKVAAVSAAALAVVSAAAGLKVAAPGLVRGRMIASVNESCPRCTIEIGRVDVDFLRPGRVVLHGLRFEGAISDVSRIAVEVGRLSAIAAVWPLAEGRLEIERIEAELPRVTLTETDGRAPPKTSPREREPIGSAGRLRVGQIDIKQGEFIYAHAAGAKVNRLRLRDVRGEVVDRSGARVRLRGEIGTSGSAVLAASFPFSARPNEVDLDVVVERFKFEDVAPFMRIENGIRLKGTLLHAHGSVRMRGRRLSCRFDGAYEDLTVDVEPTPTRSRAKAFLMNLGAALVVPKKNVGRPAAERHADVALERRADESIVEFLLRGLQDGALKVAGSQ